MKKAISLFLIVMTLISCENNDDFETNSVNQNSVDVYVTGKYNGNPCYWKNNQLVVLDDGGFSNGKTEKIIVSDNDIYVLGYADGNILYWKNGILTILNSQLNPNSELNFHVSDMFIDGNDVYFCGRIGNYSANTREVCYWKNGVKTILSSNDAGSAGSIIVANNDVFVAASKYIIPSTSTNYSDKGVYKNGVYYSETDYCALYGLRKINNEVYLFGTKDNTSTGSNYQGYYKNLTTGNSTYLSNSEYVRNLNGDNNNLYFDNGSNFYTNNTLTTFFYSGVTGIIDFKIVNNNSYILSIEDTSDVNFYLDINNSNSMQINAADGEFTSILVL